MTNATHIETQENFKPDLFGFNLLLTIEAFTAGIRSDQNDAAG